jgi:hypothetical protein
MTKLTALNHAGKTAFSHAAPFMHINFMRVINKLLSVVTAASFAFLATASELAVSPIAPLFRPELTAHNPDQFAYPIVAVNGTNAVFMWDRESGPMPGESGTNPGHTNIFLTRLDPAGNPIDAPPLFVAPSSYTRSVSSLIPAERGFFMVYFARTNAPGNWTYLVTRITPEGQQQFAPIVLETNTFRYAPLTGNGRTLLIVGGTPPTEPGIKIRLLSNEGRMIPGVITNASSGVIRAASDESGHLVVWRPPATQELRATRILNDGQQLPSVPITNVNTFGFSPVIGHGKNGYLLICGSQAILLREDGTEIRRASTIISAVSPNAAVYPEGDDWIVFSSISGTSQGPITSKRINGASLAVTANPYPSVSVAFTPGLTLHDIIVPFGPGRYLVATHFGPAILTKSVFSRPVPPIGYVLQQTSRIVSSPFGYLAVWHERDLRTNVVCLLRMAKDGTPLDPEPLRLHPGSPLGLSGVFDGEDYLVGWAGVGSIAHIVRVAPLGAPDVRQYQSLYANNAISFSLVAINGAVYAWEVTGSPGSATLGIYRILPSGSLAAPIFVRGESLASDGERLFAALFDSGVVYVAPIDPQAPTPEGARVYLSTGSDPYAVSGPGGVLVSWSTTFNGSAFVYLENGVKRLGRTAPVRREFGLGSDYLIVAGESTPLSGHYTFTRIDLLTGSATSTEADLGNIRSLNIASAGADFLALTDSVGFDHNFVGKFWITTAARPMFSSARVSNAGINTTLSLNADRRYRIETSADLIEWNLADVISGETNYQIATSGGTQKFVRAILVPE